MKCDKCGLDIFEASDRGVRFVRKGEQVICSICINKEKEKVRQEALKEKEEEAKDAKTEDKTEGQPEA